MAELFVRRADLVSTDLVKGSSLAETLPIYERHGRVHERSNTRIVKSKNSKVKEYPTPIPLDNQVG